MATATGNSIMARAHTIASQTATDANMSQVIDSSGGIRALLNHTIRQVYREKAKEIKFLHDITTRNTVAVTTGTGACPDTVMREFLHLSEFQDDTHSLITYYAYAIDADSGQNFGQLGYVWLEGDSFRYTAPLPTGSSFTGDLYVTAPCFPVFPGSMAQNITFPSVATIDDVVLALAAAITGQLAWSKPADDLHPPAVRRR